MSEQQLGLDFGSGSERGFLAWQEERRRQVHSLALQLGLPLGRHVEVRLFSGAVLCGRLHLSDEELWLPTTPDNITNIYVGNTLIRRQDIDSCVSEPAK
jgi:hypothetical protein